LEFVVFVDLSGTKEGISQGAYLLTSSI
jgi:hypothetical protein